MKAKQSKARTGELLFRQAVVIALLKTELVMKGTRNPARRRRVFLSMLSSEFGSLLA